jgi:hypothetical protein
MGRIRATVAVVVVCAGAAIAASAAAAPAQRPTVPAGRSTPWPGGATRPSLRLLSTHPVRVRGAGFVAGETVRVSVRAGEASGRRRVVAGRGGAFAATLHVAVPGCTSVSASAVGASGDRAVAARLRVLCAVR